ncbi:TPA: hypothetical protein ACYK3B_001186 [Enterococcus faecium]|uniref:hypothetical protein n=1 Tax=Enterococcus faecium TaxID=1352 RepID=UPI00391D9A4A
MSEDELIGTIYSQLIEEFVYTEKDLWMIAENIAGKIVNQITQLNDNQKIVFEQLKINAGSKGSLIKAIHSLYNSLSISPVRLEKDGAEELLKARNALARLTRKQAAEVLAAFANWTLEQEEMR